MIALRTVTDAVLAHLNNDVTLKVGDHRSPQTPGQRWAVLHALTPQADGGFGEPERALWLSYRVTAIALDPADPQSPDETRRQAQWVADKVRARLLDRAVAITGTGFTVGGRQWTAGMGPEVDGRSVNVVDDYRLYVAP